MNEGGFESRLKQPIVHAEALCEMMAALTGDTLLNPAARFSPCSGHASPGTATRFSVLLYRIPELVNRISSPLCTYCSCSPITSFIT